MPRPVTKNTSLKPVSSPIPEDQQESDQGTAEQHLKPSSQPGQEKSRNKQQQNSVLEAEDVVHIKGQKHNLQVTSMKSQNSPSEVGMFVSLANQTPNKTNTRSLFSSASNSDDEFEILDESRVYGGKTITRRGGAKLTAAQRKQSSRATVDATQSVVAVKGKDKVREVTSKSPLSSNNAEGDTSSADPKILHRKTKGNDKAGKSIKMKPGKASDEDRPTFSADTKAQRKRTKQNSKAEKNSQKTAATLDDECQQISSTDADTQQVNAKTKDGSTRIPSSSNDEVEHITSTDSETQRLSLIHI